MSQNNANIDNMIDLAKAQVGYHEGRKNGHWDNDEKYAGQVPGLEWANYQAWCAVFVSWLAMKADLAELYPRTASTDQGAAWFKSRGQWHDYPAIGAQVFYGTNGDMYHTGIVTGFDAHNVYTVEGNTNTSGSPEGDGVYIKSHLRTDPHVQGYGYPAVPGGLVSADPAYHPKATPTRPTNVGPDDKPVKKPELGPNFQDAEKALKAAKRANRDKKPGLFQKAKDALKALRK